MESKQRLVMVIAGIALGLLIMVGVINFLAHHGKIKVDVEVAPSDSTLFIDGKKAGQGKMWLTKTTHTFKATRQYFGDVSKTLDLNKVDTSIPIYLSPIPNTPQALEYLSKNPKEQQKREAAGAAQDYSTQKQLSQDEFVKQLPFFAPGGEFQVDYDAVNDANGNTQITIYVLANTDQQKSDALSWIRSVGADPNKLHIVYQANNATQSDPNYVNPSWQ